jgi:ADP-heptose:LPS heptosyltransferase
MIYILITYLASPVLYLLLFFRQRDAVKKILIIQTAKIGDLICSTPVFREVKKKYPGAHITVIANPITKELLEYNPNINEVITIQHAAYKGLMGKLKLSGLIRRGKYDIGVCLNPNIPFAVILLWGFVPIRLSVMPDFSGFTFKLASVFFTHLEKHIRGKMVIQTYMQMLRVIGISSGNILKEIYKSGDADEKAEQIIGKIDKPLIGIAVSSGNKLKELGADKIASIINAILDNMNAYIVLIGSEQETKTANTVVEAVAKRDSIINAVGKLHLKELPALIERLSLFIGVDTGIIYMADALSIPLIDIAGPSDMKDQRPTDKNAILIQKNDLPCVPCSHAFRSPYYCKIDARECIESITAGEILKAVRVFPLPHKE